MLVDAANVVGSRPDGWWRDRPAAAARLVERLAVLAGTGLPEGGPGAGDVVSRVDIVLEGAARAGVPEGVVRGVVVHHAPASGDDALVALSGRGVLLVTADRELTVRARAAGTQVAGPRWLLGWLDELA